MKFPAGLAAGILAAISALPLTDAFFRVVCGGPLVRDRLDPIVSPGSVASHAHTVSGGNAFSPSMTYADAIKSTCTSCNAKEDRSNYWTPDLWVQAKNGSFHPVGHFGHTVYYLQRRATKGEKLVPFPAGFKMLAGDPFVRSYDPKNLAQQAVKFSCLGTNKKATPGIPSHKCPAGLRAEIVFPNCWDGKNLDSTNHKSHMAYPDGVDHGKCPPSHPKRMVTLFFEILFNVKQWDDYWNGNQHPFVLSTGDRTGYSFHGDFVNGWVPAVLEKAVNSCGDGIEHVEDCPALTYNPPAQRDVCKVSPRVDEEINTWIPQLPGCNPIQGGPKNAVPAPGCAAVSTLSPPKSFSSDLTASHGWGYLGCAVDSLSSRVLPFKRKATKDMTIEKCVEHCLSFGYKIAGLEYTEECYCGNLIDSGKFVADANCGMMCGGDWDQYCGGPQRLSVYKKGAKNK